jgi:hypothetical protein
LQAAKLLGSVDAVVKPLHITIEPDLLHFHRQTLAMTREQLSEAAFQSAWDDGQLMTLEEAIELALKE